MYDVFINYRAADIRGYAALLHMELGRRFGSNRVFLDSVSIPAGADFVEALLAAVRTARVLLAVIGPGWLTMSDAAGRRRLDDPQDWVRRELAEAFRAGVRVVPVLIDDAELPREEQLPVDIVALVRCEFRRLRHHDARADLERLVTELAVYARAGWRSRIGQGVGWVARRFPSR
jgi:hypothetical protein